MTAMPKILVLDDDGDLLEMVGIVLTNYKMDVHSINKSGQLFTSIDSFNPDVILMDIFLGDADGRILCHTLKTSEQYKHIPVILYSAGHIGSNSIEHSKANDFFSKPFDISALVKKIQSYV